MLISSTPKAFALDVLPYLNREYDADDNDDGDDNVSFSFLRFRRKYFDANANTRKRTRG